MTFFRHLNLSSRLLLGLVALAASVGVGIEMLRPGHHVHLGNGGHHHHWHMGPHSHGEGAEVASNASCSFGEPHHHGAPGTHDEAHPHDESDHGEPHPHENEDGAFVDAFPLEEAADYIVLGAVPTERGPSFLPALKNRTTASLFLPITPRGPPSSSLV